MPPKAKKAPTKKGKAPAKKKGLRGADRPKDGTLRPQDERFCQGVARGMSGTQAYRKYLAKTGSTATAMQEASRVLHCPQIAARIKELRMNTAQVMERHHGVKRETVALVLWEIIETPVGELTRNHRLATKIKPTKEGIQIEGPNKIEAIKEYNRLNNFVKDQPPPQSASISDEVRAAFKLQFSRERPAT